MSIAIRTAASCTAFALVSGCQQYAFLDVSVEPENRVLRVQQINGVAGLIPDQAAEKLANAVSLGGCPRVERPNWYSTKYTHNSRRMPLRHHRTAAFFDCMTPEKDTK